jgi:hypothetical protein
MTVESLNTMAEWFGTNPTILLALIMWTFVWKGIALWKAAGLRQKWWFIAVLMINTLGILEIFYIYFVARKYTIEVIEKN